METATIRNLAKVIHEYSGILLGPDKDYLLRQKLYPLMEEMGLARFDELLAELAGDYSGRLKERVAEALTVNETSFFRDLHPYESFSRHLLPLLADIAAERKSTGFPGPKVRIWSAASSTGQEPYSLAMQILDYLSSGKGRGLTPSDFSILGTDISGYALDRCRQGRYTEFEMQRGLPTIYRDRYFRKNGNGWEVGDALRQMTEFRRVNLAAPFEELGRFDLIFCRNVLIYFDDDTKRRIVRSFRRMLAPDGCLMLGACENLSRIDGSFTATSLGRTVVYHAGPELEKERASALLLPDFA